MKRVLKITSVDSVNKYTGIDDVGRSFSIDTDRSLIIGQSVLLVNGIVTGVVKSKTQRIYEV